jgi:GDPmannose 4,6-dehydratase
MTIKVLIKFFIAKLLTYTSEYQHVKVLSCTKVNYREAYNMFTTNGILFNHESPIRGETFVTRKITRAAARIYMGVQDKLFLGNLNAQRDWGHAKDYVEAMYLILQQDTPDDFVIATGVTTSIREFVRKTFEKIGIEIDFKGTGINEKAFVVSVKDNDCKLKLGDCILEIDQRYFRPTEVELLVGDASKARKVLGWLPKYNLDSLIEEMITEDMKLMKKLYVK